MTIPLNELQLAINEWILLAGKKESLMSNTHHLEEPQGRSDLEQVIRYQYVALLKAKQFLEHITDDDAVSIEARHFCTVLSPLIQRLAVCIRQQQEMVQTSSSKDLLALIANEREENHRIEALTITCAQKNHVESSYTTALARKAYRLAAGIAFAFMTLLPLATTPTKVHAQDRATTTVQQSGTEQIQRSLRQGEYIVSDAVMQTFQQMLDTMHVEVPKGLHVNRDFLGERKSEFESRLMAIGYAPEHVGWFSTIFTTPGTIILSESGARAPDADAILVHERFHGATMRLSSSEQRTLRQAAESIIQEMENNPQFGREKNNPYGGFYYIAAHRNWEEFYAYRIIDAWTPNAETMLKQRFPQAHRIAERLTAQVQ